MDVVAVALMMRWNVANVQLVYREAGVMDPWACVSLVGWESGFNEKRFNVNDDGTVDWGLYQLNERYHPQYRGDLVGHCRYGAGFLLKCLKLENGDLYRAFGRYNAWKPEYGVAHSDNVSVIYWLITGRRLWESW